MIHESRDEAERVLNFVIYKCIVLDLSQLADFLDLSIRQPIRRLGWGVYVLRAKIYIKEAGPTFGAHFLSPVEIHVRELGST